MDFQIRTTTRDDAAVISELIVTTLHESNGRDYSAQIIEQVHRSFSPQAILALMACKSCCENHVGPNADIEQPVGAGLPAMRPGQVQRRCLTHRHRWQASSHRIVESAKTAPVA
jgi:hypothetical protein